MTAPAWPPAFDIHTMFGPDLTPPPALDWNKIQAFARFALDSFIGQIAIAFGGISILGWKPFDFLADWGQQRIDDAQANYLAATTAQTGANYANAQLTGLLVTDVTGGVALNSLFSGAAGTTIGASFTQAYFGPGGGTWGRDGQGNTVWNASGGTWRMSAARYNAALATDYQRVRIVLTTPPEPASFGGPPQNYLLGRMNAAADTFVYARFTPVTMEIGYFSGGTDASLASTSFTPAQGDTLDLFLGTEVDDRQFIVRRNGLDVLSYTDASAVTAMGTSNLYVGLGATASDRNAFTAQSIPGGVKAWGAIDRQATTH